jgi:phospholipid/cholesterol/gamma-HCH transport system permease protein
MASAEGRARPAFAAWAEMTYGFVAGLGDLALFSGRALGWLVRRRLSRHVLLPNFYYVGVRSVPVVAITGGFIGMVLAIQIYREFNRMGLATRLGAIINISIVRELGPVLAATMIAGRIGSAMAAELGTMRISEQIDALECLGVNALHYLVAPRFLACVALIPLLTIFADFAGITGGGLICTWVYHVESHFYWSRARDYVGFGDVLNGLVKSIFFGAAIALISCHRGFSCRPGAEGVGRAATEAFVASFIAIMILDFFLSIVLNSLFGSIWPATGRSLI